MKQPLDIKFRDMPRSEALEADIREKAEKLDRFYEHIMACHVVIEAPHGHHHQGNLFHVRIDLTVPGGELVAERGPKKHHAHENAYVAVRDAFNAIKKQLQSYAQKQRGDTKKHEVSPHGSITELVPMEDFGRIQDSEGRDVYFHRNSLINANFDLLEVGDEVWFAEEMGEAGLQASSVHIVGKHHPVG